MAREPTLTGVGSDPGEWQGTHIRFTQDMAKAAGRKTMIWVVLTKQGGFLGEVRWFGRWRKYSFFPAVDCVFEELCLREISQFLVDRTREHRTGV